MPLSPRSAHIQPKSYGPVQGTPNGPNEGLTLLGDELLPNGIAEIEPGIDHFYTAADIEVKPVAMANVVAEMLWGRWPDEPLIAKLLQLDY